MMMLEREFMTNKRMRYNRTWLLSDLWMMVWEKIVALILQEIDGILMSMVIDPICGSIFNTC